MTAEETTELFRRLVTSFIDFPRDLDLEYREMHGRVDWKLRGNISDQGKLVGRSAAHIKALRFLLEELGDKQGLQYHLRLDDPPPGDRAPPGPRRMAGKDYKPAPLMQLLADLLGALLDEPPAITVSNGTDAAGSAYTFTITCQRVQDHSKLLTPVEGDATCQTILTALGTLFRAAGHKDGATIKLEVPSK